jgi:hypothetical protein
MNEIHNIGTIAMWSASRTLREDLVDALAASNMPSSHVPPLDNDKNFEYAMKQACKEMSTGKHWCEVKRKWRGWHAPDPKTWDIVRHETTSDQGEYDVMAVVSWHSQHAWGVYRHADHVSDVTKEVNAGTMGQNFGVHAHIEWQKVDEGDPEALVKGYSWCLSEKWEKHRNELSGGEVSSAFKDILEGMDAQPLKKHSSVFWVSPEDTKVWLDVRKAMDGVIPVQAFTQAGTADSLNSLLQIIEAELSDKCQELEDMVRENSTNKATLEKKARIAREVRAKIRKFEGILGTGLDSLKGRLQTATATTLQAESSAVSVMDDDEVFSDLKF